MSNTLKTVDAIINEARVLRASDIHFEQIENGLRVRFRTDGLLNTNNIIESQHAYEIISRLKIMSDLDIAQRRLPQDGRFEFIDIHSQKIDCRVATSPTVHGEKIVLRLLENTPKKRRLNQLGLSNEDEKTIRQTLAQPQGLILITGPTGSGKTQTLYSLINELNAETLNICTAEDPVEIKLANITQTPINHSIGLDFAKALRTFLRQDPDVIMIGEIRDQETAEIALRAAQTGHLILSTLHTNNAHDAIVRLTNMGVKSHQVASALRLIVAQRLVRKPNGTGRTGIFSLLQCTKKIQQAICRHQDIEPLARMEGMQSLWESGLTKVHEGLTSHAELMRVIGDIQS